MTPDDEGEALARLAARVGADPKLVQGPGGDVSLKRDGVLWAALHGVATDPDGMGAAAAGSLHPDHVTFLGPGDPWHTLTTTDEAALLGRDAEKDRQALDGQSA